MPTFIYLMMFKIYLADERSRYSMNKKKFKVLYLVNIPSPYRVDFFNGLGKLCDLTVLFERKTSDEREDSWYNNNFTEFKAIFLKGKKIKGNNVLCFDVTKYLKKELFDIIVIGGYSTPTGMLAIEILKFRGIPYVLNVDGGFIKDDSRLKYLVKKRYIGSASYWLSTGLNTTNYLVYYGAKRGRIYNYPFTSIFQDEIVEKPIPIAVKNNLKSELDLKEDKVIISIGRFIKSKGFDVLLKACKKLPENYGIYIIGGEATVEYKELRKNLNLKNVHFLDFKKRELLKKYYMASDLFVLPTREDVWGLVINEAIAQGLPVITTNKCVAGLELIEDKKNGFIVPVNNSEILANKIKLILKNNSLKESISKNNLKRANKYTIEEMVYQHLNIFVSILSKGN